MSTRDRILTAAADVLVHRGVAGATTKEIARAAACSEALLYKYFADKQELFLAVLAVLAERIPAREEHGPGGAADLAGELTGLVVGLLDFFAETFPIAVSIFGAPGLLAEHRDGVRRHGFGPEGTVELVRARLGEEQAAGRVRPDADLEAAARTLVGYAFHLAFLTAYEGRRQVTDAREHAARGVALVLPALTG